MSTPQGHIRTTAKGNSCHSPFNWMQNDHKQHKQNKQEPRQVKRENSLSCPKQKLLLLTVSLDNDRNLFLNLYSAFVRCTKCLNGSIPCSGHSTKPFHLLISVQFVWISYTSRFDSLVIHVWHPLNGIEKHLTWLIINFLWTLLARVCATIKYRATVFY